mgnify:FL=1|jgi:hypothetical protein
MTVLMKKRLTEKTRAAFSDFSDIREVIFDVTLVDVSIK